MNVSQFINLFVVALAGATATMAQKWGIDPATWQKDLIEWSGMAGTVIMTIVNHFRHATPATGTGGKSGTPLLLLLCLLLPTCLVQGCASTASTAYKTEATTDATVSAAMTAWGQYVEQFHPPISQEQVVESAFDKYQAAELLAIDATTAYVNAVQTNAASANVTGTTTATTAATQALNDLLSLVSQFETSTNN